MDPNIFFENFELLAEAPNGVQKLRELILQLAVMGKLVPQDPEDEPASILIEKIKKEKTQLIKEGKNGKRKNSQKITREEIPYNLPTSWEWTRLSDISYDWGQKKPDVEFTYIDVASINKELGLISDDLKVLNPENAPSRARKIVKKESVIYSTVRPYLLNIAIVDKDLDPEPIVSTAFAVLHPHSGISNRYLYHYLRSKPFTSYVESEMKGMAYPAINDAKLYKGLIPLPPLAEQKRIVAKVDELMALCDQLETRQQKKKELRSKLNSAALDKMLSAESQDEFEENWRRICENFDLLYDNPENVEKLRKAVLQLAVQGKLVEQDEGDEPAGVLIEKIEAGKKRLVKEGKIKKSKKFSVIGKDEIGKNEMICSLPNGWEWIRLGELGEFCGGGTPSKNKHEYWDGNVHWVSPKDMKESRIKISEMTITEKALEETRLRLIPKNSILIVARSGILKRLLPVSINDIECTVNQDLKVIIPFCPEVSEYLQLMLKGYESFILKHLVKGGMTVQSLKYTEFENHPFPLPPLNEQKRIVEKVEQLMGLCDELESKLRKGREESERMMQAVVRGLLESAAAEI
ncbi:MAG: restriction endonuclease subunit S [Methanosarcinaceae archaeon]